MTADPSSASWRFIDDQATFELPDPDRVAALYFPLVNDAGLISVVTPTLHGDLKAGQGRYLTLPVSVEDLHLSRAARNFWLYVDGYGPWSTTGNSARQMAARFSPAAAGAEPANIRAGFLWHRLTRSGPALGLRAEITTFVPLASDLPAGAALVELTRVLVANTGHRPLTLTPTAAVPLFARSADRLRDHRHVTSLLHRVATHPHGVVVRPSLVFDERGHRPNPVSYAVLGAEADGAPPVAFFPDLQTFVGPGGALDWPRAVVDPTQPGVVSGHALAGREAMGGLRFRTMTLRPGESAAYILVLAILDPAAIPAAAPRPMDTPPLEPPTCALGAGPALIHAETTPDTLMALYGDSARFDASLAQTKTHWERKLAALQIHLADARLDGWLKWVTLQPVLRRICGNSFLPYHDYGRGGRGWRDLWQDQLALLIMEPAGVPEALFANFAGVRADGSNATIIGDAPGEFRADRNNIPRVWMDHGAWPLLTTRLYLDQSGDLAFLLRDQAYFKDAWTHRAAAVDPSWDPAQGAALRTASGSVYRGSVLEHLLVQHLTAFYHVGEHNIIRLEGADWNDGLDMARTRGESVAFTALYAGNLRALAHLALALYRQGVPAVDLFAELLPLLDTLNTPLDYGSVPAKQARLAAYFAATHHTVRGECAAVPLPRLAADLAAKADWLVAHLRRQEWLPLDAETGWFNGYYDDEGRRLEGIGPAGARMTLTGQVFALLAGVATDDQARHIVHAVDRFLTDPAVGGPRLNTDLGPDAARLSMSLGRCFGFAYGHKENGAMFSHMAVMYANALYRRGLVHEGFAVLDRLHRHCQDFSRCGIYPGLPEYIDPDGRGAYPYLTGSASWYLLTVLSEALGVQGRLGDLLLQPKLLPVQFDPAGRASVQTLFAGRRLLVAYHNPDRLPWGHYAIASVFLDGAPAPCEIDGSAVLLPRAVLAALPVAPLHCIEITLGPARPPRHER